VSWGNKTEAIATRRALLSLGITAVVATGTVFLKSMYLVLSAEELQPKENSKMMKRQPTKKLRFMISLSLEHHIVF